METTITQIKLSFSVRLDRVRKTRKGKKCGFVISTFYNVIRDMLDV